MLTEDQQSRLDRIRAQPLEERDRGLRISDGLRNRTVDEGERQQRLDEGIRKYDDRSLQITRRQLQVLQRLAEGDTYRQIAAELFITPNTARTHTRDICQALGARNRSHAVAIGFRRGHLI